MSRAYRPHRMGRPHGRCTACGALWPCQPAKLALLVEFEGARVSLAVYLASLLHDALSDAYALGLRPAPAELHARFLGWFTRSRETAPQTALRGP